MESHSSKGQEEGAMHEDWALTDHSAESADGSAMSMEMFDASCYFLNFMDTQNQPQSTAAESNDEEIESDVEWWWSPDYLTNYHADAVAVAGGRAEQSRGR